jgi:hypothetical protein
MRKHPGPPDADCRGGQLDVAWSQASRNLDARIRKIVRDEIERALEMERRLQSHAAAPSERSSS